jgi:hypothetical protein
MEQCDATASLYTESPYQTGDSDFEPKYSLSNDPCPGNSDSNSSSLHVVKICALNKPQNSDLTVERENRNQRAEKK